MKSFVEVLNRIADVLETQKEAKTLHFQALEMKLDNLIIAQNDTRKDTCMDMIGQRISNLTEAVRGSNTFGIMNNENDKTINKNILKLKDLRGQYLRSEKTSKLMEELLAKDVPYVQQKYRAKVSKDTHEDEILCHKSFAERNARTEIALMRCRMKRWEDEINILKTNISTALAHPNTQHETKVKYEVRIKRDEETNIKERDAAVKKIRDTYEKEVNSGATQFLLKFIDGENARSNRDFLDPSTKYPRRYRERPIRNGRSHQTAY